MIKLITTEDHDLRDIPVQLVDIGSRGVDHGWAIKRASVLTQEMAELKPEPGKTMVHVLAVGNTESYGPNRNGDGFSREWNKKAHTRFVKHGNVFKHHQNKDPSKAVGQIKLSAHNDEMDRIELVIALDNEKCANEIQRFAQGKDLAVSMGCKVAYDICSICGHKAPNPAHYCEHAKTALGRVLDDGRQVFVDNPDPGYFELSLVGRPADRQGYGFRKVASAGTAISSVDLAKEAGLWLPLEMLVEEHGKTASDKLEVLKKLAEIEKEVETSLTPVDEALGQSCGCGRALDDQTVSKVHRMGDKGLAGMFSGLSNAQVLLPLEDFLRLINRNGQFDTDEVLPGVSSAVPGCFSRMLDSDPMEAVTNGLFDGGTGDGLPSTLSRVISGLIPGFGLGEEPLNRRVTLTVIRPRPAVKVSAAPRVLTEDPLVQGLAQLYASYKLAFAANPKNRSDSALTRAVVIENYTQP